MFINLPSSYSHALLRSGEGKPWILPTQPCQLQQPCSFFFPPFPLRYSQPFNRTLLIHHLAPKRVRRAPAHLHDGALALLDVLHADGLCDAVLLLGSEAAAGLRLEFEGVALFLKIVVSKM